MIHVEPLPTLPTQNGDRFPVRRILCIGKNYSAHVREMGGDPERDPPIFFDKPLSALLHGPRVHYPRATHELHHEVELVVALGVGHTGPIAAKDAHTLVAGSAVGVDLTRRDLQSAAKKAGNPWDLAKGFAGSAPVGVLAEGATLPAHGSIELSVNGAVRQRGDLAQMLWSPAEVLAEYSKYDDLMAGDIFFTGTPAGVGPLVRGDRVSASVAGAPTLSFQMI
ncbi:MAG: fumarylacetoacetate hydrolase family protein [Myxococcota bacterium]